MGSVTYNFLADSILFNEYNLSKDFHNIPDIRLEDELIKYRNHCIDNYNNLVNEIKVNTSSLNVFTSIESVSKSLLTQTALYIEQFIISDPLFKLTDIKGEISDATAKYLGYAEPSIDKSRISKICRYLKDITPMIAADYIKIFPLSHHFERPEKIYIKAPTDYFNNVLPTDTLNFFKENAQVRSLTKSSKGLGWQVEENQLYPCRGIAIDFMDDNQKLTKVYHLFQTKVTGLNEEDGTATIQYTLPNTPPSSDLFDAWVTQSVNSAAKAYYDTTFTEAYISSNLNSTYLCDSNFTNRLLSRNFDTKPENIQTYTTNQLIDIDLPFLQNINIQSLMDIRKYESDIFTNFRIELEKQFRELRTISDPLTLKLKKENIFHELNDVQGLKIKQKLSGMRKHIGTNTAIAIGGLAASFPTSGLSLLATAIAVGKGYKDYLDYKEKVKENPAYLLWKIKS